MSKVTVKQLQKKYKDANEVISVQYSRFNMKDYDIDSIYHDVGTNGFYIKDNNGNDDKELYDCHYNIFAEIIN